MRQPRQYLFAILYILLPMLGMGQSEHYSHTCHQELEEVKDLFDNGRYLSIYHRYSTASTASLSCTESIQQQIKAYHTLSSCYIAMLQDADVILTRSAIKNPDDVIGDQTLDYLILEKVLLEDWNAARFWFEQPHFFGPSTMPQGDWQLTYGYVLFQIGHYEQALLELARVPEKVNSNYFLSQYYSALCYTNLEDLNTALEIFKKLENYAYFKEEVPIFIGEILYEQKDYQNLLEYAWPFHQRNEIEGPLSRLAGLAAHAIDDCQRGSILLEHYITSSDVIQDWEYYTKALCDYQLEHYRVAQSGFERVAHLENEYGQMSNYYLADIYMKIADRPSARNAFFQASLMNYDTVIQAQSHFYYAKLCAELKYDNEALLALRRIDKTSRYYEEAQFIMKDVLLSTSDLDGALSSLSIMSDKSPLMLATQHRIEFLKSMELLNQGNKDESIEWLELVASKDLDLNSKQEAIFWLAESHYQYGQYELSESYYSQFISFNSDNDQLNNRCHYGLAYLSFSQGDFDGALKHFLQIDKTQLDERSWVDIQMRIGDCHLTSNNYEMAEDAYETAITSGKTDQEDYALYQLATINGLLDKNIEKLILLERVIAEHEHSAYLDDALFESGIALLKMDKPKDAIRSFQGVIDGFQNTSSLVVPSLLKVGLISYNLGDNRQAADYYKDALGADPMPTQKQEALLALKEIYVDDLARPDIYLQLVEDYGDTDLKEIEKDSLTYASANLQLTLGRYDRAIEAYKQYVETYPNGAYIGPAHFELAECYLLQQSFESALQHFMLSCENVSASHSDGCFKGGEIAYHYAEDFELSMKLYLISEGRARTIDEVAKAQLGVLRSAHRLKDDTIRLQYGQKILEKDKLSVNDLALAHYSIAKGTMALKDSALAIPHLNFVAKNSSTEMAAESRYLIGLLYFQNGETAIASTICDEANKKNINYPYWVSKGLILYSDILRKSGDDLNAVAALQAVIENAQVFPELQQIAQMKLDALRNKLNQQNKLE